jgi:hypothetical protein
VHSQLSTPRALWILGVFTATYVGVIAGAGGALDSLEAWFAFVIVLASIVPLALIHEAGHVVACWVVGYRVRSVRFTLDLDAVTEWEAPPERESTTRTVVALAGGPALTLVAAGALLAFGPAQGFAGAWRAGLVVFAVLWTADILAPLPRDFGVVDRDGFAIARELEAGRAARGDHGPELNALIAAVDAALLAGEHERARRVCDDVLRARGGELRPEAWGAVAARLALAQLARGVSAGVVTMMSVLDDAARFAPRDPVIYAVQRLIAKRHGGAAPTGEPRPPTAPEARIVALAASFDR